jgi:hypothetical protein
MHDALTRDIGDDHAEPIGIDGDKIIIITANI